MTPPKRACSSTLDATRSASSSVPRTMPTPVSSQDDSMPRTIGSLTPSFSPGFFRCLLGRTGGVLLDIHPLGFVWRRSETPESRRCPPLTLRGEWVVGDRLLQQVRDGCAQQRRLCDRVLPRH